MSIYLTLCVNEREMFGTAKYSVAGIGRILTTPHMK